MDCQSVRLIFSEQPRRNIALLSSTSLPNTFLEAVLEVITSINQNRNRSEHGFILQQVIAPVICISAGR